MPDDGQKYGNLAPDLAVEVLSPRDRPRYVLDSLERRSCSTAGTCCPASGAGCGTSSN
jgi:hypothetical protein